MNGAKSSKSRSLVSFVTQYIMYYVTITVNNESCYRRGYAEAEIEAIFAKYDADGDRILDENEQLRMQSDLEGQKDKLNQEIEDVGTEDKDAQNELEDDGGVRRGGRLGMAMAGVSYEEFTVLSRRVDRMEHSIGSIVSKIDAVLVKLEAMERAKSKRRETMGKILDSITEVRTCSHFEAHSSECVVITLLMFAVGRNQ